MKTTKLIFAAVLVLLASATYAQKNRGLYALVEYSHEMNRFETWVSHIGDRISHLAFENSGQPVISKTFYTDYAHISFDDEATFDEWMATPFEDALHESEPAMEAWMSRPFKTAIDEEELQLEDWMSCPFETDVPEEELYLEAWMSVPFETKELMEADEQMTASNN